MSKLSDLIETGHTAIAHVGYANYIEREREAEQWFTLAAERAEAEAEAIQKELATLKAELKWAWDNLAQDLTYPQEGNEYDYCVTCGGKWGKHKKSCKLVEHKEAVKSLGVF